MSQEKPPVRSRRELRQARDENTAPGSNGPGQVSAASNQRRAADAAVDSVTEQSQAQRSSQIRARDRAALRAIKELEEKEDQLSAGGPPTRRQLRLQQLKEQAVTSANPIIPAPMGQPLPSQPLPSQPAQNQPNPAPAGPGYDTALSADMAGPAAPANGAGVPAGMSVEQALAARTLVAEQAKNQLAKMEHIASLDPEAVDPDILAEQIALAERAAVLNRRAMAKRKLAEQAAPAQPVSVPTQAANPQAAATQSVPQTGPATADNLAMVTPLEFVRVPGVDRPVMKPPATSYVPLATQAGPKVRPGSKGRQPSGTSKEPAAGSAQAVASGRSRVIARAEAAARAAAAPKRVVPVQPVVASTPVGEPDDLFDDLPRIPARSAHGLEPLDAATAGLARAKRLRLMQVLVLAFGILALISGVILIVSGISS